MRQIIYGLLCLLGDPRFVIYDGLTNKWTLKEKPLDAHLTKIHAAGATGIHVLPYGVWEEHPYGIKSQFQPYVVLGSKFDLAHFNNWYFPIAHKAIQIAKKNGMKTWWCWLDNCQFQGAKSGLACYRKWSPWVTNIQGIADCYDVKAVPFIKTWIRKCCDEFKGLDVRRSWGNEMNKPGMLGIAKNAIFPMIKKLALDPKKMTYGATMQDVKYYPPPATEPYPGNAGMLDTLKKLTGDEFGDKFKLSIWKEVHGIGGKGYPSIPNRLDQALTWWARKRNNRIRIWLSDDGVWDGDSKCDRVMYQGKWQIRPSAARWTEMVKMTMDFGNDFIYEHLPKSRDDACNIATIKAMSKAING